MNILLRILVLLGGLLFLSLAAISLLDRYSLSSKYKLFVVQSGSMEPSIKVGDLIIINKQDGYRYKKDDVVTFRDATNRTVTHRIIEIEKRAGKDFYSTKGDANRTEDIDFVSQNNIVGKVILTIPKGGYLVSFTKTKEGMIMFIIIPLGLIVLDELRKVLSDR